jgi:outer membrane protein
MRVRKMGAAFRLAGGVALLFSLSATGISSAEDLATLYALAQANDPTFQSARYALDAAKQKQPEAFSALLPSLVASGSVDRTYGRTKYSGTPEISRNFSGDQWVLQLTQPLFRIENLLVYDEARASVAQAFAQYSAAEQDLILRLSRGYFDVLIAERHEITARAQVDALNEQLDAARRSYQAGVAAVTDVDDTQSRAALALAQQVAARNDLDAARAALEAILGEPPPALDALKAGAALAAPAPADAVTWVQRAVEDQPNVKAAQAAVKAADYALDRSRAQRLPSVDLVAGYGGNYSAGNITEPVDFGTNVRDKHVSIQLSMPLLDGGGIHARVKEARAQYSKAQADLAGAQRQAALDARQAYGAILSGLSQIRALETAVAAGQSAVKGNRIGYGLGVRINSDVLNSEQQLFSSMQDLDKARYDTLFQGLKLKAATGALTLQDLKAISGLLQPAVQSESDRSPGVPSPVTQSPGTRKQILTSFEHGDVG